MIRPLLIALLLMTACRSSRVVTVESTPASSINTRVDTSWTRPPRLAELPRVGVHLSYPTAVRHYRDSLRANTLDVVELVIEDDRLVVRTPIGETEHLIPSRGQRKTIRPEGEGMGEYVEGEPEPERTRVELPPERGFLDRLGSVLMWGSLVVVLIVVAVLVVVRVLTR